MYSEYQGHYYQLFKIGQLTTLSQGGSFGKETNLSGMLY